MGGMMGGPGGNGLTQGNFRFRQDDGTETDEAEANGGGTYLGAINSTVTVPINYGTFRVRINAFFTRDSDLDENFQLYVAKNDFTFTLVQKDEASPEMSLALSRDVLVDHDDSTEYTIAANDLKEPTSDWQDTTNGCVVCNNNFNRSGVTNWVGDSSMHSISAEWVIKFIEEDVAVSDVLRLRMWVLGAQPFTGAYGDHECEVTVGARVHDPVETYVRQRNVNIGRILTR